MVSTCFLWNLIQGRLYILIPYLPNSMWGGSSSAPQESAGEHSSRPQVAASQEVDIEVKPVCHPYFKDYPIWILHLLLWKQPRLGEVNYLRKSHPSDPHWRKRMGSLASVKCTSQLRNNEYKISLRANMRKPQNPMAPLLTPPPRHPAKHTYIKQRDV